MKKKLLIIVIIIVGLLTAALLYIHINRIPVEVEAYQVSEVNGDTYYDIPIISKTEKENLRNNVDDYYDVWVRGSFSNDTDITYVRWICYSKKNYDNNKVWLFYRREGASVVYPHSVEEGIGLRMIIYAPDSNIEEIEHFVKNELEIFALGKIMKNKKDTAQ